MALLIVNDSMHPDIIGNGAGKGYTVRIIQSSPQ
jgi:hypothetical protein